MESAEVVRLRQRAVRGRGVHRCSNALECEGDCAGPWQAVGRAHGHAETEERAERASEAARNEVYVDRMW